jgi:hypothetical protein
MHLPQRFLFKTAGGTGLCAAPSEPDSTTGPASASSTTVIRLTLSASMVLSLTPGTRPSAMPRANRQCSDLAAAQQARPFTPTLGLRYGRAIGRT